MEETTDVDLLAGLGKGGQLGGDDHGGHVLELDVAGVGRGRQGDAHLLQIVLHRLGGVGHLGGLVARAIEADHQPIAGQLVAAHALHGSNFLDAQGLRGLPGQAARQGRPATARLRAPQRAGSGAWTVSSYCPILEIFKKAERSKRRTLTSQLTGLPPCWPRLRDSTRTLATCCELMTLPGCSK